MIYCKGMKKCLEINTKMIPSKKMLVKEPEEFRWTESKKVTTQTNPFRTLSHTRTYASTFNFESRQRQQQRPQFRQPINRIHCTIFFKNKFEYEINSISGEYFNFAMKTTEYHLFIGQICKKIVKNRLLRNRQEISSNAVTHTYEFKFSISKSQRHRCLYSPSTCVFSF